MSQRDKTTEALAIVKQGGNALQQLAEYQQQQCNILAPIDWSGQVPAGTRLSLRVEKIDPKADTYPTEGGKSALLGQALDRLAANAGVSFPEIRRTDDRKHPYYVEFQVTAMMTDCDGTTRYGKGTRAIDLQDDAGNGEPGADLKEIFYSAQHAKGGPRDPEKQIMKARQYIVPMCETKAKYRAVRHLLSIKGGYYPAELEKPFVSVKLVVDTSDQMAKQMVLSQMTGHTQALYGREEKVLEADFQDAEPTAPAVEPGEEVPGGSHREPPPSLDPLGTDKEAGEGLDEKKHLKGRVTSVWKLMEGAGMTAEDFRRWTYQTCGRARMGEMTLDDIRAIERAAEKYITGENHNSENPLE
jgi:hypothetical protein